MCEFIVHAALYIAKILGRAEQLHTASLVCRIIRRRLLLLRCGVSKKSSLCCTTTWKCTWLQVWMEQWNQITWIALNLSCLNTLTEDLFGSCSFEDNMLSRQKKVSLDRFKLTVFWTGIMHLQWTIYTDLFMRVTTSGVRTNLYTAPNQWCWKFNSKTATAFRFTWTLSRLLMPVMIENRCPRCHVERMSCSMLLLGGGGVRNVWFDTNLGGGVTPKTNKDIKWSLFREHMKFTSRLWQLEHVFFQP